MNRIKGWAQVVLVLCGFALIVVLFVPMWRIDLEAPQYPEGLALMIYPDRLGGNIDIINGLNHYIGMKTLHTDDFIEFTILPYIIGLFAAAFILIGLMGKRRLMNILAISFVAFGIIAMYDFWRWEYNYGHNLDPDAAIIVPGMAYQPPLIGFKQLLNFGAYSVPDTGGWIFIASGVLLMLCVFAEWKYAKKTKSLNSVQWALLFIIPVMSSCNTGPEPIKVGTDHCYFCKMSISDARFGGEIVSKKGKLYKFDDIKCMQAYLEMKDIVQDDISDIYTTDYCNPHQLVSTTNAFFLQSEEFRSPMAGNLAGFALKDSLTAIKNRIPSAIPLEWKDIHKP